MNSTLVGFRIAIFSAAAVFMTATLGPAHGAEGIPAIGDKAPDFRLPNLQGDGVQLSKLTPKGPVIVVVLRGFPGYQCPACNAQTGQLIAAADKFAEKKAQVVLVYPGSAADLKQHAARFAADKTWPRNFHFTIDSQFELTNQYGLRWSAPNETAYPSTFIVDSQGKTIFSKVSKSHGGRATVEELLKALPTP
jgi:peroxiredoxin Q/BCP